MEKTASEIMMETLRQRILDQYEEDALLRLGGRRFGIEIEGTTRDPWELTADERLAWIQTVHEAMTTIREDARLVSFTRSWAGLDKEHRDHLLDENSHLFAKSRLTDMKAMTEDECAWIKGADSWEVADFLTDNGPIYGSRPSLMPGNKEPVAPPVMRPSFAMAA
ncbi:hypothetical protein [Mesorhizobium sp. A623]